VVLVSPKILLEEEVFIFKNRVSEAKGNHMLSKIKTVSL